MHHIIRQMDVMIQRRCSDLFEIKQGALVDEEFPKIIWVRMLKRPKELAKGVLALHGKFNSILEEQLLDGNKENHYIMSIDVSEMEFNATGNLSLEGKKTFWKEVDRALRKFDLGSIKLHPRQYKSSPS